MFVDRRSARLILFMILLSLPSAATATPLAPKQAPSQASLICEVSPEVKQGEKGTIRGSGFTPNAEVDATFNRPDGTSSNHTGKADGTGAFNGTFTVDRDRPAGAWTLILIDKPSGRSISTPFTVTPIVAPAATSTPESPVPLIAKPRKTPGRSQPDAGGGRIWEYLERWLLMIAAILGFTGIFIALLIWWLFKRKPVEEVEEPEWEKEAPPTGPMPPTSPPVEFYDTSEDEERPPRNEDQPPESK